MSTCTYTNMDVLTLYNQRDNIIAFAKERLNDDHQRIFAEHFMMCFTQSDDQFPIDGDLAMNWLGYDRKHKFKEAVSKILFFDVDYKFLLTRAGEQNGSGGHNKETIKLSVDGFKKMEMYAHTQKGMQVRSYYIQLEKLLYEYGIHQHKIATEEARREVQNLKYILEAERENTARKLGRRVDFENMKDVVYLYQESHDTIKVGEAADMKKREDAHRSSSYNCRMVYAKQTTNRKLLEKVVHHILDQYRIDPQREWFRVSYEIAKEALDTAHLFLDGLVNNCDKIHEQGLFAQMQSIMTRLRVSPAAQTQTSPLPDTCDQAVNDTEEDDQAPNDPPSLPQVSINEILHVKNPMDFDKFIEECCVHGEDQYAFLTDLFGAHRYWGRCCLKTTHDGLSQYLKDNFRHVKRYDPVTNATLACYKGISIKPIVLNKDGIDTDIDQFIEEICEIGYTYRVACKTIYKAFEEWKRKQNPDYVMSADETKRLCNQLSRKFVPASVYVENASHRGYFCISLKNSDTLTTGKKLSEKLKKPVIKIDMNTMQVVETFDSLQHAARSINRCASNLSTDIKYKKPFEGYIFQYC